MKHTCIWYLFLNYSRTQIVFKTTSDTKAPFLVTGKNIDFTYKPYKSRNLPLYVAQKDVVLLLLADVQSEHRAT